jgi:nucleoside-diphosphate-sugar epimerase
MNNNGSLIPSTQPMSDRSVVVIGGSGFIGTCLVRHLRQREGSPVQIVDKVASRRFPDLTRVADVRSPDALRTVIPEQAVLVNLAAEHRDDVSPRSLYDDVNVDGARNVCRVANEKRIRTIVFTSSVAVYGFAPLSTSESGAIKPFNDYGRTKYEAEEVYRAWQTEVPHERTLVIVRPTVVFGEQNRGNVYNLLRQIATGRFAMVGDGRNSKSMAYVENVAAFLEYAMGFQPGVHTYNFIDKPDFTMEQLVGTVSRLLGKANTIRVRIPFIIGYIIGKSCDMLAWITGRKFAISAIRVRKFCADSVYESAIERTGFVPPVTLAEALERTVRFEFLEAHERAEVFFSE